MMPALRRALHHEKKTPGLAGRLEEAFDTEYLAVPLAATCACTHSCLGGLTEFGSIRVVACEFLCATEARE